MKKFLHNLKRTLLADKKKLGLALSCVAVGLLLWGRLLLKDVRKSAIAIPDKKTEVVKSPTTPQDKPGTLLPDLLKDGVSKPDSEPEKPVGKLFDQDPEKIGEPEKSEKLTHVKQKSDVEVVDHPDKAATLVARIKLAASELVLKRTIVGETPGAILNGQSVKINDTFQGFQVKEIHSQYVILHQQGVTVKLYLQRTR